MNASVASKIVSMQHAIAEHVPSGSMVVLGAQLEQMIPFAAGHEIIRQGRRDLTLVGPISDILFDQMIGAGCVSRVLSRCTPAPWACRLCLRIQRSAAICSSAMAICANFLRPSTKTGLLPYALCGRTWLLCMCSARTPPVVLTCGP